MLLNERAIRRKIRAVEKIQQITKAMRAVAAARLRRVREKVEAGRPYYEGMRAALARVAVQAQQVAHPLLEVRPVETTCVVAIGGDRGLCGSYNVNLGRAAHGLIARLDEQDVRRAVVTVGRRARDFLRYRKIELERHFPQLTPDSTVGEAAVVARYVRDLYESGRVDEVRIVYTRFISPMEHRPTEVALLPLRPPDMEERVAASVEYIFEPVPERLLANLLPRYFDTQLYHLLLEAMASEQGARMVAMTAATDNAGEMIDQLTLARNKARQQQITRELLDIVGGAEALRDSVA
ncbi:MAG: ATP synthase F1 subunit gamma [Armatimonadota bacterium]